MSDVIRDITKEIADSLDKLCRQEPGTDYMVIVYDRENSYYLMSDTAVDEEVLEVMSTVANGLSNPNRVGSRRAKCHRNK